MLSVSISIGNKIKTIDFMCLIETMAEYLLQNRTRKHANSCNATLLRGHMGSRKGLVRREKNKYCYFKWQPPGINVYMLYKKPAVHSCVFSTIPL